MNSEMKQDCQKEDLALRLILCCRNELYSLFPYLDGAFASLPGKPSAETTTVGTDGEQLLFCPSYLIAVFGADPAVLRRGYLHLLLHCLYLHPFRRDGQPTRRWNLACDMAVEQILRREAIPRLEIPEPPVKTACFNILGETPLDAVQICRMLEDGAFPYQMEAMEAAFLFDDHGLWEQAAPETCKKWEHILSYTNQSRQQHSKKRGSQAGDRQEELTGLRPGTYDYRTYLRQFAVLREERELDLDSFDYIYYNLGMEQYGNIPLMEPLEYREGYKLEELVIAIDTSGSCSKEVVQQFLSETYAILSQRENFFQRMQVYLIQCDCMVQSVAVIHSEEEWKNYSREITIVGRGGTDFTPVFRYVEEQRQKGKLRNLKALLYFTDGDGFFPREKTAYETAFVFLKPTEQMAVVPSWATVLLTQNR